MESPRHTLADVRARLDAACVERDAALADSARLRAALRESEERAEALLETLRLERRTSPRIPQDIAHIEWLKKRLEEEERRVSLIH